MAKYTGSEGGEIPLETAAAWTANYREKTADPRVAKSHFFGREILLKLLEQEGCVGIRMYYGIEPAVTATGEEATDEEGTKQLILVGADAEGNDLEELVVDRSSICPPECITTGSLSGF